MHKIDSTKLSTADCDQIFEAILKQATDDFEYEMIVQPNDIPLLNKYLFKWSGEKSTTTKRTEKAEASATMSGAQATSKMMMLTGEASGSGEVVKVENPKFKELTSLLPTLTSAKKVLTTFLGVGADLQTDMEVASASDSALCTKHEEITKAVDALTFFVKDLRATEAKSRQMTLSTDQAIVEDTLKAIKAAIDSATAHQEGFKMLKARMIKFLPKDAA
jgi:hypothetical protein